MTITFRSGDIAVLTTVLSLTVGLGRKFVLKLGQLRPGTSVRWTTENDPVLDVREAPDKLSARVKATELGVGYIYIAPQGEPLTRIRVTVVPMNDTTNEAVSLNGKIGPEEPDA